MAADALIFTTVDDLSLSGTTGHVQIAGIAALAGLWSVNLLVSRPRQLRAFGSALPVETPSVLGRTVERRRHVRQGCIRMAMAVLVFTLGGAYIAHWPFFGLGFQLVVVLGLAHTWGTTVWWERRHGVHLWKPPLSAVGREEWRRSPYFVTPAAACPSATDRIPATDASR
ncbi:hypothetical protein [Streptomyces sp. NPDC006446]|uniref:hypothetical protein n=1 Tax=Streptomyces sp. NPDC006446 TaxID=3154301 RepID=UPI0033BF18A9